MQPNKIDWQNELHQTASRRIDLNFYVNYKCKEKCFCGIIIEKGERFVPDYEIAVIADYFKVSADYLLGRTEQ